MTINKKPRQICIEAYAGKHMLEVIQKWLNCPYSGIISQQLNIDITANTVIISKVKVTAQEAIMTTMYINSTGSHYSKSQEQQPPALLC